MQIIGHGRMPAETESNHILSSFFMATTRRNPAFLLSKANAPLELERHLDSQSKEAKSKLDGNTSATDSCSFSKSLPVFNESC
jgi:hypothetical protein